MWLALPGGAGPKGHSNSPTPYSSDTVYLSASGSQATLPIHTPWATSLSRRPRFLPRMVSRVPPSKGPLRGSICQATRERGKWGSEAGMPAGFFATVAGSQGKAGPLQTHHLGESAGLPVTWWVTGAAN